MPKCICDGCKWSRRSWSTRFRAFIDVCGSPKPRQCPPPFDQEAQKAPGETSPPEGPGEAPGGPEKL